MTYVGRGIDAISNVEKLDNITFDGSTTYNLTKSSVAFTPSGKNNILVSINGVIQQGNFTVANATIIFDFSPSSNDTCNFIMHYGTGVLNTPADDTVKTATVQDDAITLAKMASGTDGNIISYDASGNPVAIATGNDGQVLTSTGAGSPPAFESISAAAITSTANGSNNRVATYSDADSLNGEANLTYNGTILGVGGTGDLGTGVHVKTSDTGGSVSANSDNLVLEENGNVGLTMLSANNGTGHIFFGNGADEDEGFITYDSDNNRMRFGVNGAEQMRIDSNGFVGIGDNNPAAKLELTHAYTARSVLITNTNAACDDTCVEIKSERNTNAEYNLLLIATGSGTEFRVQDNGNVFNTNNSYGALSDERVKQNITDANSQWDDVKALKIRNFKLKSDPTKTQLGIVAQELETANMSGLVEESKPEKEHVAHHSDFGTIEDGTADNGATPIKDGDGNITGYEDLFTEGQKVKSVKYSVLYMKAIKCLQEAITKIETLETENTDIKARLTALEDA
jgi:hypothetical protein